MEIRDHAKLRFVQRVMGKVNVQEAKTYIRKNEFEVVYKLLEFISQSELLFKGYAPARRDTLDYYVNNETLIIMKPNKKELVTLFDITLDSEDRQNSEKIKQYVKKIKKNNYQVQIINGKQAKQDQITHHLEYMINYLDGDIDNSKMESIREDRQRSIDICKDLAAQAKTLRMENRELMSEMFKKIDKDSVK
ncbi:hypothetical protein [Bacillus sp. T33-2]|uniref:hypothetical protein n=1 Tax=Bacillus sp. T33-2 TaxID=2054168 RepID=UPI000C76F0EE|nr:hypothetical protein [Bacillus sp. T33-2]